MEKKPPEGPGERRKNLLLRMLIDEMMGQIRELQRNAGPLPADERARLEADLARIMEQVRTQAFTRKDK
jgi:hypothetical protein